MSSPDQSELQVYQQQCQQLLARLQSLALSTLSEGQPDISYAPFWRDEGGVIYIYVSELAAHTHNLMAHARCSVMFIEDESACRNIFARERLTLDCRAIEVGNQADNFTSILDQMEAELGQTVALLRSLPDFRLFALTLLSGRYVVGFGKAFEVTPSTLALRHITMEGR